jgi:hypothetical protein
MAALGLRPPLLRQNARITKSLPESSQGATTMFRVEGGGGALSGGGMSHPDLRANPNARIHLRQDQVTHMHRLIEYQNTV